MKETLYNIVGDKIREFCEKTYYSDIVFSFEQSYDGKEWTKEVEIASFDNGTDLCYMNDWNEGQIYLRNLLIWHLVDSKPVKHGCAVDVCREYHLQREQAYYQGWEDGRKDLFSKIKELYNIKEKEQE